MDFLKGLLQRDRGWQGRIGDIPGDEIRKWVQVILNCLSSEQKGLDGRDTRSAKRIKNDISLARVSLDISPHYISRATGKIRMHPVVPGILLPRGRNGFNNRRNHGPFVHEEKYLA